MLSVSSVMYKRILLLLRLDRCEFLRFLNCLPKGNRARKRPFPEGDYGTLSLYLRLVLYYGYSEGPAMSLWSIMIKIQICAMSVESQQGALNFGWPMGFKEVASAEVRKLRVFAKSENVCIEADCSSMDHRHQSTCQSGNLHID